MPSGILLLMGGKLACRFLWGRAPRARAINKRPKAEGRGSLGGARPAGGLTY